MFFRRLAFLLCFFSVSISCKQQSKLHQTVPRVDLPESLDFGDVYLGDVFSAELVIHSIGTGYLEVLNIQTDHPEINIDFSGQPIRVKPYTELKVAITWTPRQATGLLAYLTIQTNAADKTVAVVELTGMALPIPLCNEFICKDGKFNRATETCEYTNRQGSCEDNNICTLNTICVNGECIGQTRECFDNRDCTIDSCDPAIGCVFATDLAYCDDQDPCSADICNAQGECEHPTLPNGTSCGLPTCLAFYACLEGTCYEYPFSIGGTCNEITLDFGNVYIDQQANSGFVIKATIEGFSITNIQTSNPDLNVANYVGRTLNVGDELYIPVTWQPTIEGPHLGQILVETTGCETWVITTQGYALTIPTCDDSNVCTQDTFDHDLGICIFEWDFLHCPWIVNSVSAGGYHTCGVKTDNSAVCWGYNAYGQATVPTGSFLSVSAGWSHTCGVKSDNSVVCWGDNTYKQSTPPTGIFISIGSGNVFSCGIRQNRTETCWGNIAR